MDDWGFRPRGENYVRGVGYATWHYICMLSGNDNLVKPDVHVKRFVEFVLGYEPCKTGIVTMLQETANVIGITPKQLDNSIWNHQRAKKR